MDDDALCPHASPDVEPDDDDKAYGMGTISFDKSVGRWRLRRRVNGTDRSRYFDSKPDAKRARRAIAKAYSVKGGGLTLREWGEIWLEEHDYGTAVPSTWHGIVCDAPFIDWPLVSITSAHVASFAASLLQKNAKRSVLIRGTGKRELITLDRVITRSHAKNALSALRSCLNAAKNREVQLIATNPAADVELPAATSKNGKKRTKAVQKTSGAPDFLPQDDCRKIFFCTKCEERTGVSSEDLEQLVRCEHMGFFYRVALSISIMQGLREGELASQRWERISWTVGAKDPWAGHTWLISTSWKGDTKNGQVRMQALIPMAARLLHRWWEFKGCPESGLLFCTADADSKRPLGELAKFVARYPNHPHQEVMNEARRQGLKLTLRRVETLRSESRKRAERKRAQADRMFAKGYDFAWSHTDERDDHGVLRTRPGWRMKLGLSAAAAVFHDHRDTAATHLLSGTWGPKWSLYEVSKFIGHSDVKVTEDRYAHLTSLAKTDAAATIDPARPSTTGRAAHPSEIVRQLSGAAFTSPQLSTCFLSAPEAGLEPTTNRLTAGGSEKDSIHLDRLPDTSRPLCDSEVVKLAKRVLEAAAGGTPLRASALQLAGTILDAADEGVDTESTHIERPGLRLVKTSSRPPL